MNGPAYDDERLDRIGRLFRPVFVALLAAYFIYGYLGGLLF